MMPFIRVDFVPEMYNPTAVSRPRLCVEAAGWKLSWTGSSRCNFCAYAPGANAEYDSIPDLQGADCGGCFMVGLLSLPPQPVS